MKTCLKILACCLVSLTLIFLLALRMTGQSDALKYAAKIKPYAAVFQTADVIREARRRNEKIILFFGDSSVAQPPWAEKHASGIPELLEKELRGPHSAPGGVSVIDWAFNGARLFHYYCLLFEAEKHEPALIVIPINWRMMGPRSSEWNRKFAFAELSAAVPPAEQARITGRSMLEREGITPARHAMYSLRRPLLYLTGLKMWGRVRLGMEPEEDPFSDLLEGLPEARELITRVSDERLFKNYTAEITDDNAQLAALRSLVETSTRRGIRVLFYITPIHLQEMQRRKRFDRESFRESVARVAESATSETCACLDMTSLLGEKDFIDYFEHYTENGNHTIARALAPGVTRLIGSPLLMTAETTPPPADVGKP